MFRYIFDADYKFGGLAQVELKPIDGPLDIIWSEICAGTVIHGETEIYGYRFGSAAYLTDPAWCRKRHFKQLEDLDILFLDALRYKPHPTHSTVENSLRIVGAGKTEAAPFSLIFVTISRMRRRTRHCLRTSGYRMTE